MLRHRDGRSVGQLVGRPHHERLEGEFVGGEAVAVLFRLVALDGGKARIVQDGDVEIGGEDVQQRILDVLHEKGFDVAPFEVVCAVEDECIAPDVHRLEFIEPGGDGSFRELAFQLG